MNPWPGYDSKLSKHLIMPNASIRLFLALSGILFYSAIEVWLTASDPCVVGKGMGHHCIVANFWSQFVGISRAMADAQYWGALGCMAFFISIYEWRRQRK